MSLVAALFKFQVEEVTSVYLTLMVVLSVGDIIIMVNPPRPSISELGAVVNNPANSTIILLSTKLYSY